MHASYLVASIGVIGYALNAVFIFRYVKGLQSEIREEVRKDRRLDNRRENENRDEKWKTQERVIKENSGYKWCMYFGTLMFLTFVVGVIWIILRLLHVLP